MDLQLNDLTYHSRKRKDQEMLHSFTPLNNMPLKYNYEHQKQPNISTFLPKQSFSTNPHLTQTPMHHHNISPIAFLQNSQEKTHQKQPRQTKENYEIQQQRIKLKTLSEHLKSALMANNQVEERYNLLKLKMEEKQVKFMNDISVLKAETIMLQKKEHEKNQEIKKKNQEINQLKQIIQNMQKSQKNIIEKYQNQLKNTEYLKNQLTNHRQTQNQLSQMRQILSKKDSQILELTQKLDSEQREVHQYEEMLKKQEHLLQNVQKEQNRNRKSYQNLRNQNHELKETVETQKKRIQELNKHIGEICHNSDHLFEEIKQNQIQKEILNQKMDQKQLENINLAKNLQEMIQTCHVFEIKCEELKMGQDIFDQKTRQLLEKHSKLQEQNIEITRINTDLLREIQLLDQEVRELKQVCLKQECRQAELLTIIKDSEDEICKLKKDLKEQAVYNIRKDVQMLLRPTRDVDRRTKTEHQPYLPYQRPESHSKQKRNLRESLNDTKGRFNYLNQHEHHQNELIHVPKQNHPYSQFLSFEPSKPYDSLKEQDPKTQGYTFGDHQLPNKRNSPEATLKHNYYIPEYNRPPENDRKSKSFYVERKGSLVVEPHQVYKSTMNPRERQNQSIKAMRNSLDLREKSLDLHNALKASRKEVLDVPKYKPSQRLYTEGANHPQPSYDSKDMFLSKLGKLKLWPKQSTSQQVTERQALKELPSSHDYYKSQVPIQTVIKQKSTIIQQRKNMMGFNLNNQMIQKNILKLQKNGEGQRVKQNYMDGLSVIRERREQGGGMTQAVHNACKKVLYNN